MFQKSLILEKGSTIDTCKNRNLEEFVTLSLIDVMIESSINRKNQQYEKKRIY